MAGFPPTQDFLSIHTGNQKLEGWLDSTVTRGVETCPSRFNIQLTERYPTSNKRAIVLPGNSCEVYFNDDLVMTGYIDEYSPSIDGQSHNVRISGRSKTQDVVDSSYWPENQQGGNKAAWHIPPQPLSQAVRQILTQMPNVGLTFLGYDPKIPNIGYPISPGESIYAVLESLCRMCSKLLWDDEKGNIVISDVGTEYAGSPLLEGENVLAAALRFNWEQRFGQIVVTANAMTLAQGVYNALARSYIDDEVQKTGRKRVKVRPLDVSPGLDNEFAKRLANWEQSRRIGRSFMLEVHVVGWRDGAGKVWTPNTLVQCEIPTLKVGITLVIVQCDWRRGANGTTTHLTLMQSQGLEPIPFQPQGKIGVTISPNG